MHPRHPTRLKRTTPAPARRPGLARRALHRTSRLAASLALAVAMAAGLGYAILKQGPVSLDAALPMLLEDLNAGDRQFAAAHAVFALGRAGRPSGLRLREVTVRDAGGALIAAAPEIALKFRVFDVLRGDFAPTRIAISDLDAVLIRRADGRLDFDLGAPAGAGAPPAIAPDGPQAAAEGPGLLGLLNDGPDQDGPLARLRRIEARGLRLRYRDLASGIDLTAEDVDFTLRRTEFGLHGVLNASARLDDGAPMRLVMRGLRSRETGRATIDASLRGVSAAGLARRLPEAAGLAALEADLALRGQLAFDRGGALTALSGALSLGEGRIAGAPPGLAALDGGRVDFAYDPAADRLSVTRARIEGGAGRLALRGAADFTRAPGGAVAGVVVAMTLQTVEASAAALGLDAPVTFTDGELAARLTLDPPGLEIEALRLRDDAVDLTLTGRIETGADGAATAGIRVTAGAFSAAALATHWPRDIGPGARDWVMGNILGGEIEHLDLEAGWDGTAPAVNLEFEFREARSRVIVGMPPVEGAAGVGRATLDRFDVELDRGRVTPPGGRAIDLAGSRFAIVDLAEPIETGLPDLVGRGRIADFLTLIDQPPLELTRKLGVDLGEIGGTAVARAQVSFPLLKDLKVAQVEVRVQADLADLDAVDPMLGLRVRAKTAELSADDRKLTLSGAARLDGAPAQLRWVERFSPGPGEAGTALDVSGRFDGALLKRLGVEGVEIAEGQARAAVTLRIGASSRVTLRARLDDAALRVPALGWSKPRKAPGALKAEGRIIGGKDGALVIDGLTLTGPGLDIAGSVRIGQGAQGGAVQAAEVTRLKVAPWADLQVRLATGDDGEREVDVTGRRLNLRRISEIRAAAAAAGRTAAGIARDAAAPGPGPAAPAAPDPATRLTLAVARLAVAPEIELHDASGAARVENGVTTADLRGALNGGPQVRLRYEERASGAASAIIRAEDAGAVLRALDFFPSGRGGALEMTAELPPRDGGPIAGELEIKGMFVRNDTAMTRLLTAASLFGVLENMSSGGMTFSTIRAPFRLEGDTLRLLDAVALGPSLGIKIGGVYDLKAGRVAMDGVMTPAYAVNGVLSQVPVLGQILGGEGEGLIAVTFTIDGPLSDPAVSANPLSALTPGILRKMFSGRRGGGVAPEGEGEGEGEGAAGTGAGPAARTDSKAAPEAERIDR